jgi:hypothetical protein
MFVGHDSARTAVKGTSHWPALGRPNSLHAISQARPAATSVIDPPYLRETTPTLTVVEIKHHLRCRPVKGKAKRDLGRLGYGADARTRPGLGVRLSRCR